MVLAGRAILWRRHQGLRKRIEAEDYARWPRRVDRTERAVGYTQRIVSDCKLARPMKIVVDSGNGIPGASAPGILRALGCEVTELYSEVDGDFPNHHPILKPENLQDLIKAVKEQGSRSGLGF